METSASRKIAGALGLSITSSHRISLGGKLYRRRGFGAGGKQRGARAIAQMAEVGMASRMVRCRGVAIMPPHTPDAATVNSGLFSLDSAICRLTREHFILLGGSAAAILQVAYPGVAMGVAAHSDFRADALGRLTRTLEAVYAIAFGTVAEAEHVARRIAAVHGKVRGVSPERYSAMDSDAQLWVLATLTMTTVEMHERCLVPLCREELERFYADQRVFGRYFGLPESFGPQTWDEFKAYYDEMITGPLLGSHPACAEVAASIVTPENPWMLRPIARVLAPLACDYVPEPVRSRLELPWRSWHPAFTRAFERLIAVVLPLAPSSARYCAPYRRALRREETEA